MAKTIELGADCIKYKEDGVVYSIKNLPDTYTIDREAISGTSNPVLYNIVIKGEGNNRYAMFKESQVEGIQDPSNIVNEVYNFLKVDGGGSGSGGVGTSEIQDYFSVDMEAGAKFFLSGCSEINVEAIEGSFKIANTFSDIPTESSPVVTFEAGCTVSKYVYISATGEVPSVSGTFTKGISSGKISMNNVYSVECILSGKVQLDIRLNS